MSTFGHVNFLSPRTLLKAIDMRYDELKYKMSFRKIGSKFY